MAVEALDRVVVLNDVSTVRGGATGIALQSIALLRQRGVDVTFFAGDDGKNQELERQAIDVVAGGAEHILAASRLAATVNGLYNSAVATRLSAWIAAHDTPRTVYHLHGWSKILSPSVFKALRPVAARLFITGHDYFLVCPNGGFADFQKGKACLLTPLSATCLTTNCDRRSYGHKLWRSIRSAIRQRMLDLNKSGATILSLNSGMLPYFERGGIARASLKILPNPVTPFIAERVPVERNDEVVFIGRLDEEKGPDLAAEAAARINARLRLIGEGPMRERVAALYPAARLEGWKDKAEAAAFIKSARLLVMPSRYPEPGGLAALEALGCGIPVVCSIDANIAPDIERFGMGLSCNVRDIDALSAAMQRVLQDDTLAETFSRNAMAHAAQLFNTPTKWLDELMQLYAEAVSTAA